MLPSFRASARAQYLLVNIKDCIRETLASSVFMYLVRYMEYYHIVEVDKLVANVRVLLEKYDRILLNLQRGSSLCLCLKFNYMNTPPSSKQLREILCLWIIVLCELLLECGIAMAPWVADQKHEI